MERGVEDFDCCVLGNSWITPQKTLDTRPLRRLLTRSVSDSNINTTDKAIDTSGTTFGPNEGHPTSSRTIASTCHPTHNFLLLHQHHHHRHHHHRHHRHHRHPPTRYLQRLAQIAWVGLQRHPLLFKRGQPS
jgi:hypothetical protein